MKTKKIADAVEAALALIDSLTLPEAMSPPEALACLEQIETELGSRQEALREEM